MAEFQSDLWAPWRMEYISGLSDSADGGCFLCRYRDNPPSDAVHLVLWRRPLSFALLNRFPYTNGHVMVAPLAHGGVMSEMGDDVLSEMALQLRDVQRVLSVVLNPDGFNIGMNIGRCAGAGVPDHLHYHIVPRWNGDTNFMSVVGGTRVIPQSLELLYSKLIDQAGRSGLIPAR